MCPNAKLGQNNNYWNSLDSLKTEQYIDGHYVEMFFWGLRNVIRLALSNALSYTPPRTSCRWRSSHSVLPGLDCDTSYLFVLRPLRNFHLPNKYLDLSRITHNQSQCVFLTDTINIVTISGPSELYWRSTEVWFGNPWTQKSEIEAEAHLLIWSQDEAQDGASASYLLQWWRYCVFPLVSGWLARTTIIGTTTTPIHMALLSPSWVISLYSCHYLLSPLRIPS